MNIELVVSPEKANPESQICIAIDVLRAFTTTRMLFHRGTKVIRIASSISEALELKKKFKNAVVIGEHKGLKLPEADLGNSPATMKALETGYETAILVTTNGTPALLSVPKNALAFAAGTRDLHSLYAYFMAMPEKERQFITVVASSAGEEDILFHRELVNLFANKTVERDRVKETVYSSQAAQKFIDRQSSEFPYDDLVISADIEPQATFVQKCDKDEFGLYLRGVYV